MDLAEEFNRQVRLLVDKGYPVLAGLSESDFRTLLEPLRARLVDLPEPSDETAIPFVIVVTRDLVTPEKAVPLIDLDDKLGWTDMPAVELALFDPIEGTDLPAASVYLLADIDLGAATLGVRPKDAQPSILSAGRLLLTIDEGLAVMIQHPEVLKTHNAVQLLASRCGDKRVPSIWISYGRPRLGWCWEGNPHSWLGMGSATIRVH